MTIAFDGVTKLATLSSGTTTLTVPELWSRWVDWVATSDNSKYPIALAQIGGDEISAGKYLGVTFFLENGWKIRPYEGDHTLTITGNIFSRDGSSPIAHTIGDYNVTVNMSTSNLVDTIATSGSSLTADEIASAVWNRLNALHMNTGSFGEAISMTKATGDANFSQLVDANAKLNAATLLIQTLLKYENNRTRIDQTAKTMTIYDNDGTTVLKVFDLKDFAGQPSITQVAERVPQ